MSNDFYLGKKSNSKCCCDRSGSFNVLQRPTGNYSVAKIWKQSINLQIYKQMGEWGRKSKFEKCDPNPTPFEWVYNVQTKRAGLTWWCHISHLHWFLYLFVYSQVGVAMFVTISFTDLCWGAEMGRTKWILIHLPQCLFSLDLKLALSQNIEAYYEKLILLLIQLQCLQCVIVVSLQLQKHQHVQHTLCWRRINA